jgi:hypothetical protein
MAAGLSRVASNNSTFNERVAYARWVRQLTSRGAETDRELAELSGLGYDWIHKWKQREDAPVERLMSRRSLAICSWMRIGSSTARAIRRVPICGRMDRRFQKAADRSAEIRDRPEHITAANRRPSREAFRPKTSVPRRSDAPATSPPNGYSYSR